MTTKLILRRTAFIRCNGHEAEKFERSLQIGDKACTNGIIVTVTRKSNASISGRDADGKLYNAPRMSNRKWTMQDAMLPISVYYDEVEEVD